MLDSQNKKGKNMKKKLLITLCLLLSLNSVVFCAELKNSPSESEIKQKTPKPAFSFITFDFSTHKVDSTNVCTKTPEQEITNKKDYTVPGAIKEEILTPLRPNTEDDVIHFFRLDLLGIFKIQM